MVAAPCVSRFSAWPGDRRQPRLTGKDAASEIAGLLPSAANGSYPQALGLALALTLALSLSAAAEEVQGTIKMVNPADHSIVLDDGTRLWVAEGQVKAAYETQGEKKMVIELSRRPLGLDGLTYDPVDSIQTGDEPSSALLDRLHRGHAGIRAWPHCFSQTSPFSRIVFSSHSQMR
jgi:hypothetical protein